MRICLSILLSIIALALLVSPASSAILRVAEGAPAAGDGTSWANAFPKLGNAITAAVAGDEIWVAAGAYYPDERIGQSDGGITSTFDLRASIPLYGGFAGTETTRDQRDPAVNVTILSGDITQNDTNADLNRIAESNTHIVGTNARNVVRYSGAGGSCRLDGFTITAGSTTSDGGGLYISAPGLAVANCRFIGNQALYGGGAYSVQNNVFTRCVFSGNGTTGGGGGGVYLSRGTLANCIFSANHTAGNGGAVYGAGPCVAVNCLFQGNTADQGGAFYSSAYNAVISQCTLSGNTARVGGALYNYGQTFLRNSILWGNTATPAGYPTVIGSVGGEVGFGVQISHSLVAGSGGSAAWNSLAGTNQGGNLDTNPKFLGITSPTDPLLAFRLLPGSPAIDAGLSSNLPADNADLDGDANLTEPIPFDLGNDPRSIGTAPDMGAIETGGGPALVITAPVLRVLPNSGSHPSSLDLSGIFDATAVSFALLSTTPAGIATISLDEETGILSVTTLPDATGAVSLIVSATDASGRTRYLPMVVEVFPPALHVRAGASGKATGLNWEDAFPTLQDALVRGGSSHQIRVAQGIYYPDQGGGQTVGSNAAKFVVPPGVSLLGGFDGTEATAAEADPAAHPTVLSGDVGRDDANADGNQIAEAPSDRVGTNASAFLNLSNAPAGAGIDGFILTAAGSGSALKISGGSPFVRRCHFFGNSGSSGGAVSAENMASVEIAESGFSGNSSTVAGGAVSASSGALSLSKCNFTGNLTSGGNGGGAVHLASATVSIRDCSFQQNRATATFGIGGAIRSTNSAVSTVRCQFRNNEAGYGGALHLKGGLAVSLTNCSFTENVARSQAGAIYLDGIDAAITGCEFAANRSSSEGGALYHYDCSPILDLCTLAGNSAGTSGGAIYNRTLDSIDPAAPALRNCIVWNNRIGYTSSPSWASVYDVTSEHPTTFSHCIIAHSGGSSSWNPALGIDLGGNRDIDPRFLLSPTPGITSSQAIDLRLQAGSPAIGAGSGAMIPADSQDLDGDGNTTEPLPLDLAGRPRLSGTTVDLGAQEAETGPALVTAAPRLRFDTLSGLHSSVLNVSSLFGATAIAFGIESQSSTGVISCTITGASLHVAVLPDAYGTTQVVLRATAASGQSSYHAVFVDVYPPVVFVDVGASGKANGLTWADAFPTLQAALAFPRIEGIPLEIWVAGGVYRPDEGPGQTPGNTAATFTLPANCGLYGGFAGNEVQRNARNPLAHPTILSGDLTEDDLNADGNSIAETTSAIVGPNAIRIVTANASRAGDLIDGFILTAADGGSSGGGLSCTGGTLSVVDCRFQGNFAIRGGGGFFKDAVATLTNCLFTANRVDSRGQSFEPEGGALNFSDSTAVLSNCRFVANHATDATGFGRTGGAVFVYGGPSITVTNCDFDETVAGGAVRLENALLTISDSRFSGTQAGGGLSCWGTTATLARCAFIGNRGGGMDFSGNLPLTCSDTAFSGNSRNGDGGGVSLAGHAPMRFTNCLITGNSCWNFGGGIDSWATDSIFTNCTFSANRCEYRGGAFYSEANSSQKFINCIFWANQAEGSTTTTFASVIGSPYEAPNAHFQNCIVANSGGSGAWNPLSGFDDGGNLDVDPRFLIPLSPAAAPAASGDFQLGGHSPALDSGDNALVSAIHDLAGASRITNGTVDRGSYEGQNDQFDTDGDGLSDAFELAFTSPPSRTTLAPGADLDGDGKSNLLEFAFGSDPTSPDDSGPESAILEESGQRYLSIRYPRNRWASQFLAIATERSIDLGASAPWQTGQTVIQDMLFLGDGMDQVTERSLSPLDSQPAEFLRVRISPP